MKSATALILLVWFRLCLFAGDTGQSTNVTRLARTARVTIKYPSDLRANGAKGVTPFSLDFVLDLISDFRLLYCDEQTLRTRIAAKVCIIDFDNPDGVHKDVKVSADSTLRDVLKNSGVKRLQKWDGRGQPYIRLITARAIMAPDGTEQFLKTKICAGDFIVVQTFD